MPYPWAITPAFAELYFLMVIVMSDPVLEKPNSGGNQNTSDATNRLLLQYLAQNGRGNNLSNVGNLGNAGNFGNAGDGRALPASAPDSYQTRPLPALMRPGVCASCHPQKEDYGRSLKLDYAFYGKDWQDLGRNAKPLEKPRALSAQEKEEAEKQRFLAAPVEEKIAQSLLRLPDKFSLNLADKGLNLKTDFLKLAKMVPGTELDEGTSKILGGLKELSIKQNKDFSKVSLDFNEPQSWKLDKKVPMLGQVKELKLTGKDNQLSFDIKSETTKEGATALRIEKIQGLKLSTENLGDVPISALRVTNHNGKLGLEFAIGEPPKDGKEPAYLPFPMSAITGERDLSGFAPMLSKVAELDKLIKTRDLTPLLEKLPAEASGFSETITKFLSGISAVEKNGRDITILRNNGTVKQDLGGAELSISPAVTLRLGSLANAPSLDRIGGVSVAVDVPSQLEFPNNKMIVPIESFSMSPRDRYNNRTVTVGTAGSQIADYVSTRLNGNMQPVRDQNGEFYVNTRIANPLSENSRDRLHLSLRFDANNQLNMKTSEVLGLVSKASSQGADFSLAGAGKALIADVTAVGSGIAWIFGY